VVSNVAARYIVPSSRATLIFHGLHQTPEICLRIQLTFIRAVWEAACEQTPTALSFAIPAAMARARRLLEQILRGDADANIPFSGMIRLLHKLGFKERVKASHHIFFRDGVEEILNLQPQGNKCKPYQVKQVRNVILDYGLAGEADD
jgi:predicted RNA binding protein YcfA (HicA-like mRNA interferase family)